MARKTDGAQVPGIGLGATPRVLGFDVSDYQTRVDYKAAYEAGRRFVYIKVTEGNGWKAKLYDHHKRAALAAGFRMGAYHFARPDDTNGDALDEARRMFDRMGPRDRSEMPPCLDLEVSKTKRPAVWAKAFCEEIARLTGEQPVLYMGKWFLGPLSAEEDAAVAWLGRFTTLFLPAYPRYKIDPLTYARPHPFAEWPEVTLHQYAGDATASTGNATIPGVSGPCDAVTFFGTEEDFIAFCEVA